MEEIKTEETAVPEINPVPTSLAASLDRAESIVRRQEAANIKREELLSREEALAIRATLGGRAEAGFIERKQEMSAMEYAKGVREGKINPFTQDVK